MEPETEIRSDGAGQADVGSHGAVVDRLSFAPSGLRARALDDWMHRALCDSLAHVAERCATRAPVITEILGPTVAHLRAGGRMRPEGFGTYYDMVECVSSGQLDPASTWARAVAAAAIPASGDRWPVLAAGAPDCATLESAFKRRMSERERALFGPVDEDTRSDFALRLDEGLDLLARGVPEMHAEIRAIIRTVLLAQAPEDSELEFDGASHYELWGLVLLNPRFHDSRLAVAEVLAHECGHSLLFGMMGKELLVENPYEDTFPSPLRPDPRPMDGIFHATFVSARMAFAMERLAASAHLSPEERDRAREAAERDRANFASGDSVIRSDGRLTETGARIIEDARRWIAASATG
ncbi:aKG-HExxH-type peptide beta-hydroxylase [Histidinibacterium lentulum]|uniref:HEXXH motif domain-containing protein n=1 Tax=Histidinibacterium lentulum TaxID=2480588 RepID=A0A3N2R610_9RHOB|nr:HEXXH motif-containing putative peptide modification protein [Histidinibacterium lentulum]ROU02838.1 HEXXH motif domain-containing protein [Histidinibacterium lentulum]